MGSNRETPATPLPLSGQLCLDHTKHRWAGLSDRIATRSGPSKYSAASTKKLVDPRHRRFQSLTPCPTYLGIGQAAIDQGAPE